jgi:hypothetical protein
LLTLYICIYRKLRILKTDVLQVEVLLSLWILSGVLAGLGYWRSALTTCDCLILPYLNKLRRPLLFFSDIITKLEKLNLFIIFSLILHV